MKRFILQKDGEKSWDLRDLKLGCSWTIKELMELNMYLMREIDDELVENPTGFERLKRTINKILKR